MSTMLEILAREATDLGKPDAESGTVHLACFHFGHWEIAVHVHNEFAKHHCERWHDEDRFGVIRVEGDTLDETVERALSRVRDAVADTPAVEVA